MKNHPVQQPHQVKDFLVSRDGGGIEIHFQHTGGIDGFSLSIPIAERLANVLAEWWKEQNETEM